MNTRASRLPASARNGWVLVAAFARRRTCSDWSFLSHSVPLSRTPGTSARSLARAICRPWTTSAVRWASECSPEPENQPQPPSESCMAARALRPSWAIARTSSSSKTGLRGGRIRGDRGADLLRVEIRPLLANGLEIESRPAEDSLSDHGGQEPVECLLGAAVRVVGEVRQGVDECAGEAWRVADLDPRIGPAAGLGDLDREPGRTAIAADRADERVGLELAMHDGREPHLGCVGLFVAKRLDANDRLALGDDPDLPVDALLSSGLDADGSRRGVAQFEHGAVELEKSANGLIGLQIIMNIG